MTPSPGSEGSLVLWDWRADRMNSWNGRQAAVDQAAAGTQRP